jgi:hypothetical protein
LLSSSRENSTEGSRQRLWIQGGQEEGKEELGIYHALVMSSTLGTGAGVIRIKYNNKN